MRKIYVYFIFIFIVLGLTYLLYGQENLLQKIYQEGEVDLVKCFSIHSGPLESDIVLQNISDFIVTQNGHIFISDTLQNDLKVFDQTGKFIKVIGRVGKGPGDLNYPKCLATNGTNIFVYEIKNKRTSIFDQEGNYIKSFNTKPFTRMDKMKFLPSGELLIQTTERYLGKNIGQDKILHLLNSDFTTEKIIYRQRVLEEKFISQPKKIIVNQPFQPMVSWDVSQNDLVYIGFQNKYTTEVYDPMKGKISEFCHSYKPIKITEEEKTAYLGQLTFAIDDYVTNTPPDFITDNMEFPAVKPAFYEIITDYQGNILVFPSLPHGAETVVFDAFTRDGKFIQTVKVRKDLINATCLRFTDGFLWTKVLDKEDEFVLIKYKIGKKDKNKK